MWMAAACGAAFFAALTTILAKCGIRKTDSDLATAIRTGVILLFTIWMVRIADSGYQIFAISRKEFCFLLLSGMATGCSWICYFKALSMGEVNKVIAIDKSSTFLSIFFAILFLRETDKLWLKLISAILIGIGIYGMIEKKKVMKEESKEKKRWIIYAFFSAVCAALSSVFAKIGITSIESNLATFVRTFVVFLFSWGIVLGKKESGKVWKTEPVEVIFLILSGLSTGASWLCYYYAIQKGTLSIVTAIDKLSILITVVLSFIFFKEKLSKKALEGLVILCTGIFLMLFTQ